MESQALFQAKTRTQTFLLNGAPARPRCHQGGLQETHRARSRVRIAVRRHAGGE